MSLIDVLNSKKFKNGMSDLIREHTDQVMEDCYKMCVFIEGEDGRCAQAIQHMQKMNNNELHITAKVSYDGGGKGISVGEFRIPADIIERIADDPVDSEEVIIRYIHEEYKPFQKGIKNANAEIVELMYP